MVSPATPANTRRDGVLRGHHSNRHSRVPATAENRRRQYILGVYMVAGAATFPTTGRTRISCRGSAVSLVARSFGSSKAVAAASDGLAARAWRVRSLSYMSSDERTDRPVGA